MPNAQNIRRVIQKARHLMHDHDRAIPQALEALIMHPRNRRVKFRRTLSHKDSETRRSVSFKSFVVDRHLTYDGITRPLKQVFWTSFAAPAVRDREQPATQCANGCYAGGKSKKHGTKVHADFDRLVRVIRGHLQHKNGHATVAHVDPCAYRLITALINRKIVPVYSEFVIFDEYSGLATAIDCLAWDTTCNSLIAVEVKTGSVSQTDFGAVCGKAHFRAPMEFVPDSSLNRAATQLMLSMLIIARRYGIQVDRGVVLRPLSTANQVQLYEMPRWTMSADVQGLMYAQLRTFVTSGANTKRVVKRTAFGVKQRDALDKQEERRAVMETGDDPARNVFWTPATAPKEVTRVPSLAEVMDESNDEVLSHSPCTRRVGVKRERKGKGKGKEKEKQHDDTCMAERSSSADTAGTHTVLSEKTGAVRDAIVEVHRMCAQINAFVTEREKLARGPTALALHEDAELISRIAATLGNVHKEIVFCEQRLNVLENEQLESVRKTAYSREGRGAVPEKTSSATTHEHPCSDLTQLELETGVTNLRTTRATYMYALAPI